MKASTIIHWERKVQEAIAFSHDDPFGDLDLKKVADRLCVSTNIFYHKFAEICGEPYIRFTRRRRLEAGAGYLRHSDYGIREISERCGYSNASFGKAFQALFHESPTAFRDREFLQNETHTLQRTKIITSSYQHHASHIFSTDRTEAIRLPHHVLYYHILPSNNDPVKNMVEDMNRYYSRLLEIQSSLLMPEVSIITGTLDVVPVTSYGKMMMYVGLLVPITPAYDQAHQLIRMVYQEEYRLVTKQIAGGDYKKLPVPMGFAAAGLPMYEFINHSCRVGYFKMSGNHFFISLTGADSCEIYIPWQRR
ncbi:helix-turn-helix transcriptional regulator [Chitinophaga nivalis]|uniref:Helix-turn-helix transcriptional regulator n=1 Tax=Chitinophaga nivalis TaxID=2991709 RepID=A0ABT3IWN9_9BACT|nr:helix-turn-helix transcriptional regulator [Chitinophaga nivalis]MCW3461924.1 helix-turn-helix transcriptional regulator [Chitinophaga nivalis]MCW3488385.1 helix-turn-helix transcriptional regulator [Chitinophaga nivalis]